MADKKVSPSESKELALHYMKTLVDVARESFLILNPDLRVVEANPTFYTSFKVTQQETIGKLLYQLGNGQWDIPELKQLLEEILPEKQEVRDYVVTHTFETIGKKSIVLNAKQVDSVQWIILAMEDVTTRKELEAEVSKYTIGLEIQIAKRTEELAARVRELEAMNKSMIGRELKMVELKKENDTLVKMSQNGNVVNENSSKENGNSKDS